MKKLVLLCMICCLLSGCVAEKATLPETENNVNANEQTDISTTSETTTSAQTTEETNTPANTTATESNKPDNTQTKENAINQTNNSGTSIFDDITPEDRKELNIFLSNFAEVHFAEYDCNNYDVSRLIGFVFAHVKANNTTSYEYNMFDSQYFDNIMGFKADVMDEVIYRYFGINIPHTDIINTNYSGRYEGFAFKNGYVYTDAADGEAYDYCAVATSLSDLGDNTYSAEFDKYFNGYSDTPSKFYSYSPEQAENDAELDYCNSYKAIIKRAYVNGKDRWQLLSLIKKN